MAQALLEPLTPRTHDEVIGHSTETCDVSYEGPGIVESCRS